VDLRTSRCELVCIDFPNLFSQSLAWKNILDLEDMVLPTMNELLKEQEALEKLELSKTNPSQRILQDIRARIVRLKEGIDGWQKQIDRVDDLYKNAGKDSSIKAVTNLVSNQLLQKDGKDSVTRANGSKADNANEIRDISAISFVGGGSVFQFYEEQSSEITTWKGHGVLNEEIGGLMAAGDPQFAVVKIEFEARLGFGGRQVEHENDGDTKATTLTRGITLSDPDDGDSFDVKVYRDPVYGSYFFVTASGFSRFDSVQKCIEITFQLLVGSQHGAPREGQSGICVWRWCGE
jgi:hypothetical protein